jgi:anthranilate phosphoribosyltransferase
MGEALRELDSERVLIVHGREGLDEISPTGETEFVKVWDGKVSTGVLTPSSFGLSPISPDAIAPGRDLAECGVILREAVGDPESPRAAAVLPSAAAAIWIAGLEETLPAAADRARMTIASGTATAKLEEVVTFGGKS